MALPDKNQLKFNIHKEAKSLMEAIEKRFGGNKETKKIYEAEVKSSSSTSHNTQNIAFVSSNNTDSTNESVSIVPNVFAASTKAPVSTLPNVDSLSDVVIYSFFANGHAYHESHKVPLKDWKEFRSPKDTRNKDTPRKTVLVEASTSNSLVSQCDGVGSYDWSFQADEEPINYALMAFTSLSSSRYDNKVFNSHVFDCDELNSSESDDSVPTSPVNDSETVPNVVHVELSTIKTSKEMSKTLILDAPIIKDWTSYSEYESKP
nr:hypothetical protein [Tanacetum cinerariifolium]